MRVFVLTTGRSGSSTFAHACRHMTNFTVGHETHMGVWGGARLDYPDGHIEVDNRLAWILGLLGERYGDDAHYVHLTRDREAVVASHLERWDYAWRGGITEAFAHGVLMHAGDFTAEERPGVVRYLVDTVEANIRLFLRDKSRVSPVRLEHARDDFRRFWDDIAAQGDLEAGLTEWNTRHNAGRIGRPTP